MTAFESAARIPKKNPWAFNLAVCAAVIAVSLFVYKRTWSYTYLDWDDNTLVEQNVYVMPYQPDKFPPINLFVPGRAPGSFMPIRTWSYIVDREWFGSEYKDYRDPRKAHWHHINNTWLYIINGIVLFFALRKLLDPWSAAIATLVWVAHPLHVEAVGWVSGRKEMLAGTFIVGAFWAYISGTEKLTKASPRPLAFWGSIAIAAAAFALVMNWYTIWRGLGLGPLSWIPGLAALALFLGAVAISCIDIEADKRVRPMALLMVAFLLSVFAFMSKPVAIVAPLILFAWEIGHRPLRAVAGARFEPMDRMLDVVRAKVRIFDMPSWPELKGTFVRVLPHGLLSLWGVSLTLVGGSSGSIIKDNATWNAAPKNPFISAMASVWLDVYHLVAPLRLSSLYDVKSTEWYPQAWLGVAVMVALPFAAVWLLWKSPKALVWLAWLVAPIIPVSGIVPIAAAHADRYLYLPAIAMAVALGYLLSTAAFGSDEETGNWERYLAAALTVAIIGGFSVLSIQRTSVWQDDESLWGDAVDKNPDLPSALNNYGAALMNAAQVTQDPAKKRAKIEKALDQYYKAYKVLPTLDVAQFNIAATEMRLGRLDRAEKYAEEFVEQHPEMPTGWIMIGNLYASQLKQMRQTGADPAAISEKGKKLETAYEKGCNVRVERTNPLQNVDKANACNQLALFRALEAPNVGVAVATTGVNIAIEDGLTAAKQIPDPAQRSLASRRLMISRLRWWTNERKFDLAEPAFMELAARGADPDLARAGIKLFLEKAKAEKSTEARKGHFSKALALNQQLLRMKGATSNDLQMMKLLENAAQSGEMPRELVARDERDSPTRTP